MRDAADGPLAGYRVLDLTRILAGPLCTMMLGDMGAEIIKVEPPDRGDDTRGWGPPFVAGEAAYFLGINRNKRSLTLDMAAAAGQSVLAGLIVKADVLIDNFRIGTLAKWGFTDAWFERNPANAFGNTVTSDPRVCRHTGITTCLANDYSIAQVIGELGTSLAGQPLTLFVDVARNASAERTGATPQDLDTAYGVGVTFGRVTGARSWEVGYLYQEVEKDALFAQWIDSDFGAGATDRMIAITAQKAGLSGLEFFIGIPGTMGGAVRMNAGAYGGDLRAILDTAVVASSEGAGALTPDELGLEYRRSGLRAGQIVASARFALVPRPEQEIRAIANWLKGLE